MKDKIGKALDLDRFRTIVDAYGTDPSKWPEAEREAAKATPAGSMPCTTRNTMPAPSTMAKMKNAATEYLTTKLVGLAGVVVNLPSSLDHSQGFQRSAS